MKNDNLIKVRTKAANGIIKPLNGGNLAPPLAGEKAGRYVRDTFPKMNIPLTRLHDAPLENAGMRLVDVHLIFANEHADADDPRNYYFTQTDDYIRNCIECGTQVYYRLGPSIEHSINKYFIGKPADVKKWIDVCDHIIRHYTEGWANGFRFNIEYWEIWNEPNCTDPQGVPRMWLGSLDEFNEFYVTVATELKKRFPHLKIGGPAHTRFKPLSVDFIKYCAKHHAPLDFYSYHTYGNTFEQFVSTPAQCRKVLDEAGYTETEIHLNEWHYLPGEFRRLWAKKTDPEYKNYVYSQMKSAEAAAFTNAVMIQWQDTPLDKSFLYTVSTTAWGVYVTNTNVPTKLFYGMAAFGDLIRYPERFKTEANGKDIFALAGKDEDGRRALLISCFKTGPRTLTIESDIEWKKPEVLLVDDQHELTPVKFQTSGKTLTVSCELDSSVILIHF